MGQPIQPGGRDNTTLFGWIGIIGGVCCGILGLIFGTLSIMQARKWGRSPVLGWIAIAIAVIGFVWNIIYAVNR
jgi:hypothetical protein